MVTAVDGLEEPYVPFVSDVIGRRNALDSLPGGRYVAEVQAVIRDVVETEGPVSPTRLAKLVAHAYGLSRVLDDRVAQINRAVPRTCGAIPRTGSSGRQRGTRCGGEASDGPPVRPRNGRSTMWRFARSAMRWP